VLGVSVGDGLIDGAAAIMTRLAHTLASDEATSTVPWMLVSSEWDVIEAGLKCIQGKPIVCAISLRAGEAEFIRQARLLRRYGAAVVCAAVDENGSAVDAAAMTRICKRMYDLLVGPAVGLPPRDIVFDPNNVMICSGLTEKHDGIAVAFPQATAWIKQNLAG
jgi:5-methyltetrahydrofolate--homocysteine methyltransferase